MDRPQNGRHSVRLRPLAVADEVQVRQAHEELAQEGFSFLLDLRDGEPWPAYLHRLDMLGRGVDVPEGWVPATFLVADVEADVVGRVSIRHELNAYLTEVGGHIGFGVRPGVRRRGYATDMLRQALHLAQQVGVEHALVICDDGNVASAKVIERCGGVLDGAVPGREGQPAKRRYWVTAAAGPGRTRAPGTCTKDGPTFGH
jgi:predicted acetyltransferase